MNSQHSKRPTSFEISLLVLLTMFSKISANELIQYEQQLQESQESLISSSSSSIDMNLSCALSFALNPYLLTRIEQITDYKSIHVQYSLTNMLKDLQEFLLEQKAIPREEIRKLLEEFSEQVCRLTDSPDHMFDFFSFVETLLLQDNTFVRRIQSTEENVFYMYIHATSLFGIFIRRVVLHFKKLLFHGVVQIYTELQKFVKNGEEEGSKSSTTGTIQAEEEEILQYHFMNPPIAENFLFDLIQKIEANIYQDKIRLPQTKLETMVDFISMEFSSIPNLHYLHYIVAKNRKEWETAVEYLHRYFDYRYCNHFHGKEMSSNQDLIIASYAALTMAALHLEFLHFESARLCIQEAIRIAHQNNENECIVLALSLLYKLSELTPHQSQECNELIEKCITRAKELNMQAVVVDALLMRAKNICLGKQTCNVETVWKCIDQSISICLELNSKSLLSKCSLFKAMAWNHFGNKELFVTNLKTILDQPLQTQAQDFLIAQCEYAMHLARTGAYSEALHVVKSVPKELMNEEPWPQVALCIIFDYYVNQMNWSEAQLILKRLETACKLSEKHSPFTELMHLFTLRKAKLLLYCQRTSEGMEYVSKVIEWCMEYGMESLAVEYYVIQSKMCQICQSYTSALSCLELAEELADKHHMTIHSALIHLEKQNIYLIQNRKLDIKEETIPHILQNAYPLEKGHLFLFLAKHSVASNPSNQNHVDQMNNYLNRALQEFSESRCMMGTMQLYETQIVIFDQ